MVRRKNTSALELELRGNVLRSVESALFLDGRHPILFFLVYVGCMENPT